MLQLSHLRLAILAGLLALMVPTGWADDARTRPRLRVLSYNIKHGRGMDGKVDLERAAAVINRLRPDLVALQEVDQRARRSGVIDQAAELGKMTDMHHAFGSFFAFEGGQYGMAILSRRPLREVTNHRLPPGTEPRTALVATVRPLQRGPEVVFANVHYYQTPQQRLDQANKLLAILQQEIRPVIIAGDFNSQPDSPVLKLFAPGWTVPDKGQDRFTFRSDRPRVEIDYIIYRPAAAFEIGKIDVLDEAVTSDHRPVVLDLVLPNTAN